jgi:ferritin-like metal-binding protein YciE
VVGAVTVGGVRSRLSELVPLRQVNLDARPAAARLPRGAHSMTSQDQDLEDLFHQKLKKMWYAEKKIHSSLSKMADAADSGALRAALKKHEEETQRQIARLGTVFGIIDKSSKGEASTAVEGLIDECMEVMVKFKDSSALDAGLVAGAQAIEHHEIACYGTLKAWAEQLGLQEAVSLIEQSLTEEKDTDEALTKLAQDEVNRKAREDAASGARRRGRAA